MIIKPPDTQKDREAIRAILRQKMAEKPPEPTNTTPRAPELPKIALKRASHTGPTTEETVAYQNREIGKVLVTLKKHMVQGFLVAGKSCDCGQKHLQLELESLCEETIPMVENPDIYYRLLEWIKEIGPKCTVEAVASGQYKDEYKAMSLQARDYLKEVMGTEDVKALWLKKEAEAGSIETAPVTSEEAIAPMQEITELPATEDERKELLSRGFVV